ncbi:hypothetical protein ACEPPN_005850 [Leptodophora sp. 'Broadleaf-Isolate-01']
MASIGKFALSCVSGVQETSLALAHLSFDFAMIRLEAPKEFQGLGTALSKKRKHEAEQGSVHATARRLGALFADDMPPIPNLSRAYGLRASEIAENPSFNPTGSIADGPLAGHVGADGTSIWAAATSGRGALQVHLLACLLARMWSASEAIAIWSELVTARKARLEETLRGLEFQASSLIASRIEVSHESLAEWDASARSWLRTGDKAKLLQQKQLMLIVDNIGLPVPSHPNMFEGVMAVWKNAMLTVEKLVSGIAQQINDPKVLVGLSSWHIYPDITFLGRETTTVYLNDDLVQRGGMITVGMQNASPNEHKGISWTMPLAQLQFYGKPEALKRIIGEQSVRVSFGHLVHVAMGSVISPWKQEADNFDSVCRFFVAVWSSLSRSDSKGSAALGWHELFSQQAISYLHAKPEERDYIQRLANLGRRRFATFMDPEPSLAPGYGLCSLENSLGLLKTEDQIKAVRRIASGYNLGIDLRGGFIVYKNEGAHRSCPEIASIFPYQLENGKEIHRRWTCPIILSHEDDSKRTEKLLYMTSDYAFIDMFRARTKYLFDSKGTVERSIDLMAITGELCGLLSENIFTNAERKPVINWIAEKKIHWGQEMGSLALSYLEAVASSYVGTLEIGSNRRMLSWKVSAKEHTYEDVEYVQAFSTDSIIVYQQKSLYCEKEVTVTVPVDYVTDRINSRALDKHIFGYFDVPSLREQRVTSSRQRIQEKTGTTPLITSQVHCLFALYKASLVYSRLPTADIDLSIASRPMNRSQWAQMEGGAASSTVRRAEAFACVAMLDTGHVDLDPASFTDVMAISSGDTLYVSEMLLNDPCQPSVDLGIRCLIGNIGRPGVALLIGPKEPVLLEPPLETWDLVNHSDFDGKLENNFKSTSLQLSLTGYEQAVNIPMTQGRRYKEVAYVEAVVSAHDCGSWVGDLNILSLCRNSSTFLSNYGSEAINSLKTQKDTERALPISCLHNDTQRRNSSRFGKITSIDNWQEFFDLPPNSAIIRAKGNWIARLALAAAMRGREDSAVWASGPICWKCVEEVSRRLHLRTEQLLILC